MAVRTPSLRARLILTVIGLAAAGLAVVDVLTYSALRSFEISRTDDSLDAAHAAIIRPLLGRPAELDPPGLPVRPRGGGLDQVAAQAARGDFVAILRLDGTVITSHFAPRFQDSVTPPPPRLPTSFDIPTAPSGEPSVRFLDLPAVSGGGHFRVRASIEPGASDRIVVVAEPLDDVESTLHRLLMIELLASAGVLLGIGVVGLTVVRLGLRPLERMAGTADAIAAGDLTRRVDSTEEHTEVGRLGLALNTMLNHIEKAVSERDRSLRALSASESRLRRFVADASHELRTPLAAVRAYAELFTRGAADRPANLERSMAGIGRESERMSGLVEDLLLLARLDEGRDLERVPVPLEEVVMEAVETQRTIEPDRDVEVSLTPSTVLGDRGRLRQVVDNLLANVRAHTPPDTPVRIGLRHEDGEAVLSVSDSGPGLASEQLEQVFERFYRADPSRARSSGGAGLGLSIVAAVVGAHGGEVGADSEPGSGATFVVRLPLAE